MNTFNFCLCLLVLVAAEAVDWDTVTPLDEYVNRDDGHFNYELLAVYEEQDHVMHVINMTSQKWMDETFSSQPIWWHYLRIYIPRTLRYNENAILFAGGGSNLDDIPTSNPNSRFARMAVNLGAVTAELNQVPNQPIFMADDPIIPRVEDLIIGYSWKKFMDSPELGTDVVLQMPMTKAAKKALDVMEEYCAQVDSSINLQRFLPFSYSKRAWVAWLLGATDRRVFAMVPAAFNLLNMLPNLDHHFRSFDGWSWAFIPYWVEGVSQYLRNPRAQQFMDIVDPFYYNERLTMPKMVAIGTGDQFFIPTGSNYFFDRLTEPKYMQMFENDDHGLGGHNNVLDHNVEAFFIAASEGRALPEFAFQRGETDTGGFIEVTSPEAPSEIFAWWADTTSVVCEEIEVGRNVCRRDFRVSTITEDTGIIWSRDEVEDLGGGRYRVEYDRRAEDGYRGFFIEASFPGAEGYTHRITTEVQVIPDTLPYPPCVSEEDCFGRLV